MTAPALHTVFVGGPGRSGTSFVADRLGRHPQVATLREVELKIFCERGGLLDLHEVLTRSYSPNRAVTALLHFERITEALVAGRWGQRGFEESPTAGRLSGAFAEFRASLLTDDFPAPLAEADYLDRVRTLLARLGEAAIAERAEEVPREGLCAFLEKTPHNLLFVDFLARIAPGASFIHVMRDPRSIAWSLLKMRWGPDTVAAAAEWVAGYCRAWTLAEGRAAELGLRILRLHIEDLSVDVTDHAGFVCRHVGLTPEPRLFEGADPDTLSRWQAKAEASDLARLNDRLGGWAEHFGYERGEIGLRPDGASGRSASRLCGNEAAKDGATEGAEIRAEVPATG